MRNRFSASMQFWMREESNSNRTIHMAFSIFTKKNSAFQYFLLILFDFCCQNKLHSYICLNDERLKKSYRENLRSKWSRIQTSFHSSKYWENAFRFSQKNLANEWFHSIPPTKHLDKETLEIEIKKKTQISWQHRL